MGFKSPIEGIEVMDFDVLEVIPWERMGRYNHMM